MGWIEDRAADAADALGLTLGARLGGRYNGAWAAARADGAAVVVKPLPPGRAFGFDDVVSAVGLAAMLRRRGYPIPRHVGITEFSSQVAVAQLLVPGRTASTVDAEIAGQLLRMMRLQADIGRRDPAWAHEVTDVESGRPGADLLALTASEQEPVRFLLAETEGVIRGTYAVLRQTDAVHTDLHAENILVSAGAITAVVDWEGARIGDWRWDLANLAWFHDTEEHSVSPAARSLVRRELVSVTDHEERRLLAATTARQRLITAVESGDITVLRRVVAAIRASVRSTWM